LNNFYNKRGQEILEHLEISDSLRESVAKTKKPYDIKTQNIKTFSMDGILVNSEDKEEGKPKSENDSSSQDKNQQDSEQ